MPFGAEALRFVNSAEGKELWLRGSNAKVVVAGRVQAGDRVLEVPVVARGSAKDSGTSIG